MQGLRGRGDVMLQVDYLVLADAAAAAEGKHYIHGAGWDTLVAPAFPVIHPALSVAVRVRVPWSDTNLRHLLELDLIDADGQSILHNPPGVIRAPITMGRPAQVAPGSDQVLPLVFNLHGLQFRQAGTYLVVLRLEGRDVARAPFQVLPGPNRSPGQGA